MRTSPWLRLVSFSEGEPEIWGDIGDEFDPWFCAEGLKRAFPWMPIGSTAQIRLHVSATARPRRAGWYPVRLRMRRNSSMEACAPEAFFLEMYDNPAHLALEELGESRSILRSDWSVVPAHARPRWQVWVRWETR